MNASDDKPRDVPAAVERAVGLLARREHSRRELQRKLVQRGFSEDVIASALAQLRADGYQSDARFVASLMRSRVDKGYGPLRIRAEAQKHGLDDGLVETVLTEAEIDWPALAVAQARKRARGRSVRDFKDRVKLAQFLQRRGFPPGMAREAAHAADDNDDANGMTDLVD